MSRHTPRQPAVVPGHPQPEESHPKKDHKLVDPISSQSLAQDSLGDPFGSGYMSVGIEQWETEPAVNHLDVEFYASFENKLDTVVEENFDTALEQESDMACEDQ
eukprot:gene31705-39961_t